MASSSLSVSKQGVTEKEEEFEELWSDLHALKKLYRLLHQNQRDSPDTQAQDSLLDEKSKLLLKKLLDEATKQAIQSQSQVQITSNVPPPLSVAEGKSTQVPKLEEDSRSSNTKEIQSLKEYQNCHPFAFQAKSGDAFLSDRPHQDRRLVKMNSSKSCTTKVGVLLEHAKRSSCTGVNVTQKLPAQPLAALTRRVIQQDQLTNGSSTRLSEPDHLPKKRSRIHAPTRMPSRTRKDEDRAQSELTQKEMLPLRSDLVALRPEKERARQRDVGEPMERLKDGRKLQHALPDQTVDKTLQKHPAGKSETQLVSGKEQSDFKRMDSLKSEKVSGRSLVKRDQLSLISEPRSLKPDQRQNRTQNSNLEERKQLDQISGRIPKPYLHPSKQQLMAQSPTCTSRSRRTAQRAQNPTNSRRNTSLVAPAEWDLRRQTGTRWDSPRRNGRVRAPCSSCSSFSHSGTSRRTSSTNRSDTTSSSQTRTRKMGREQMLPYSKQKSMQGRMSSLHSFSSRRLVPLASKPSQTRVRERRTTPSHHHRIRGPPHRFTGTTAIAKVDRQKKRGGRLRRFKEKLAVIFHHHHHHHHHLGHVDFEDRNRSTWQYLRGIFRHTSREHERTSERAPRQSQQGYLHALTEGLLRHVWHTRQRKAAKAAERQRLRKAASRGRGKLQQQKKLQWWHRFYRRGGVKLGSRKRPRLRLGFGYTP